MRLTPLLLATPRSPMPLGFMPAYLNGKAMPAHQCFVDENTPANHVVVVSPNRDLRFMLLASTATWALSGAINLAGAYRPEGLR